MTGRQCRIARPLAPAASLAVGTAPQVNSRRCHTVPSHQGCREHSTGTNRLSMGISRNQVRPGLQMCSTCPLQGDCHMNIIAHQAGRPAGSCLQHRIRAVHHNPSRDEQHGALRLAGNRDIDPAVEKLQQGVHTVCRVSNGYLVAGKKIKPGSIRYVCVSPNCLAACPARCFALFCFPVQLL